MWGAAVSSAEQTCHLLRLSGGPACRQQSAADPGLHRKQIPVESRMHCLQRVAQFCTSYCRPLLPPVAAESHTHQCMLHLIHLSLYACRRRLQPARGYCVRASQCRTIQAGQVACPSGVRRAMFDQDRCSPQNMQHILMRVWKAHHWSDRHKLGISWELGTATCSRWLARSASVFAVAHDIVGCAQSRE